MPKFPMHTYETKEWVIARLKKGYSCLQISKDAQKYLGVTITDVAIGRWRKKYNSRNIDQIPVYNKALSATRKFSLETQSWCLDRMKQRDRPKQIIEEALNKGVRIKPCYLTFLRLQYNATHEDKIPAYKRGNNKKEKE